MVQRSRNLSATPAASQTPWRRPTRTAWQSASLVRRHTHDHDGAHREAAGSVWIESSRSADISWLCMPLRNAAAEAQAMELAVRAMRRPVLTQRAVLSAYATSSSRAVMRQRGSDCGDAETERLRSGWCDTCFLPTNCTAKTKRRCRASDAVVHALCHLKVPLQQTPIPGAAPRPPLSDPLLALSLLVSRRPSTPPAHAAVRYARSVPDIP
eukprot:3938815-Rhodomonas_salina.2